MKNGYYLVIEGVDFCGKSSLTKKLVEKLEEKYGKENIVHRREPSFERYGKLMRETLFSAEMTKEKEILAAQYMLLDRIDNNTIVSGLLREGKIVIQERNFLTALAYNEANETKEVQFVQEVNKVSLRPDDLVLLTISDNEIKNRISRAKDERGELDNYETIELVTKRRDNYLKLEEYIGCVFNNNTKNDFNNNLKKLLSLIDSNIKKTKES